MSNATLDLEKVRALAFDLSKGYPRSAREPLGDYAIAGRTLDKCRATLVGTNGDYHFDCPLDNIFLGFAEIKAEAFKNFVGTGASDEEVGEWIKKNAKPRERAEVLRWTNEWREKKLSQLDDRLIAYMEDYVKTELPAGSWAHIHTWFDVYDIEEGRVKF